MGFDKAFLTAALAWTAWEPGRGPRLQALEAAIAQEREVAKREIEESESEKEG